MGGLLEVAPSGTLIIRNLSYQCAHLKSPTAEILWAQGCETTESLFGTWQLTLSIIVIILVNYLFSLALIGKIILQNHLQNQFTHRTLY